ncbi:hypothetical protein BH09PAT1_BH09PAT1_3700 [soil metagenome]
MLGIVPLIVLGIFFLWLIGLTFVMILYKRHYDLLISGVTKESLTSVLDKILGDLQLTKKDIANLTTQYDKIEEDSSLHIQKIGLVRFNPFKDTGGDQSFILSLLDAHNTGVVISGLYSRSGTRWYAKKVVLGKGFEHELSDEEVKAIHQAKHIGKEHGK